MSATLERQSARHDNDYSALEGQYRRQAGSGLVADPYGSSVCPLPELRLSASVIIPAWNARDTLERCLVAIEGSSFNRRYPERLEVVVVDDGSSDGTWELLERLDLGLRLVAVQQTHHSRAQTQNTGIAIAEGDVIISCDADMILTPFSIEELVKRHQVLEDVMLIGFRGDVAGDDPAIQLPALREGLPELVPPFARDLRVSYGAWGWPESMCRDSGHLKRLRQDRPIVMPDGSRWNLPGIVYGALFSLRRVDFEAMDGYDERFYGWGCEDTLVGVRALAMGRYVLPVYSAAGLHIAHRDRSPRKWQEFAANRRVFQAILQAPFRPGERQWLAHAPGRIARRLARPAPAGLHARDDLVRAAGTLEHELADPSRRGKYWYALGRYNEAAVAFAEVRGAPLEEAWAVFDRGKALRAAGRYEEAAATLEIAAAHPALAGDPWPLVELGLALAAQGQYADARRRLESARACDPGNPAVGFLLRRSAAKHLERAALFVRQGEHALAARDYEAALILNPAHTTAQTERALCLARLGQLQAASAVARSMGAHAARPTGHGAAGQADERWRTAVTAWLELAQVHQGLDELGPARVALEHARRLRPQSREAAAGLCAVQSAAARRYPLPHPAQLASAVVDIPGWLGTDEAELLAVLALRAAAACDGEPPVLIEIGRYCGRNTVLLGLAVQSLGRSDARIVAIDEPGLGRAPDGRAAVDVLRERLAGHEFGGQVVLAPEDEPAPWVCRSRLLLVDGRHDEPGVRGDLARYAPGLLAGGLLVFHDYADYFPDVQRCVDELLLGGDYDFVAQTSSLIALVRRPPDAVS